MTDTRTFNEKRREEIKGDFDNFNNGKTKWTTSDKKVEADLRPANTKATYIDNVPILGPDEEKITLNEFNDLINANIKEEHVAKHYKEYLHQDGFADVSSFATLILLINTTGRNPFCRKERSDLIINPDGSVTYIERFLILDTDINDVNKKLPFAIISTTSRTYFDKNTKKLIHAFENDEVYLLSNDELSGKPTELFDTTFDINNCGTHDKTVYNRIGKSVEEVNHELNEQIKSQKMKYRFEAINQAYQQEALAKPFNNVEKLERFKKLVYFNNENVNEKDINTVIDNLQDTRKEIRDYIRQHDFLTISGKITQDCLPDSFVLEPLRFDFIEYNINNIPVLRFRERFLVKSAEKPFAVIETESILYWDAKNDKVAQAFNHDYVHVFEESGKDYFVTPFKDITSFAGKEFSLEKTELKKVTAAYDENIHEIEKNLNTDAQNTIDFYEKLKYDLSQNDNPPDLQEIKEEEKRQIEMGKEIKNKLDSKIKEGKVLTQDEYNNYKAGLDDFNEASFNDKQLVGLESQIPKLFRKFTEKQANDAIKRANYLNESKIHTRWIDLNDAIRDLSDIIEANKSDELKKNIISERYNDGVYDRLLKKYSAGEEQDFDDSGDVSISPESRHRVAAQQISVIENSDNVIKLQDINPLIKNEAVKELDNEFENVFKQVRQSKLKKANAKKQEPGFLLYSAVKAHPYLTALIIVTVLLLTALAIVAIVHTSGAAIIPIVAGAKVVGGATAAMLGLTATANASFWTGVGIITAATALFEAGATFIGGLILDKTLNAPAAPPVPVKQQGNAKVGKKAPKVTAPDQPISTEYTKVTEPVQNVSISDNPYILLPAIKESEQSSEPFIAPNLALLSAIARDPDTHTKWVRGHSDSVNIDKAITKMIDELRALPGKKFDEFHQALKDDKQNVLADMIQNNQELKSILQRENIGAEQWNEYKKNNEDNEDNSPRFV